MNTHGSTSQHNTERLLSTSDEGRTVEASFAWLANSLKELSAISPVETPDRLVDIVDRVPLDSRRFIAVELIKADLGAARAANIPRDLEFYWPRLATILPKSSLPFDLIVKEVNLRRSAGEVPDEADYQRRFPEFADTICKWFSGDLAGQTQVLDEPSSGGIPELLIGSQLDDFRILRQLGKGAFASVYLARQESMQRLVALKAASSSSEEPQALSQLDHANIVRIYDQRKLIDPPIVLLYMQYLPGGTLADCIKYMQSLPPHEWNGRRLLEVIDQSLLAASQAVPEHSLMREQIAVLDWAEVVAWIGIQLAEGLAYASSKGVLHRDVKPANILLSSEAVPKLVDFNVSSSGLSNSAGAGAYFGGSVAYMSPEQLEIAALGDPRQATRLDGRSDLYALGMVLWELWQGVRPWKSQPTFSMSESLAHQIQLRKQPLALAHDAVTSTDRVLERVLRAVLREDREQRPSSGQELAARLKLALHPELAQRFEPEPRSLSGRLWNTPVLLVSALLIFVPNTAASVFNYFYNWYRMQELAPTIPNIESDFIRVADWVNGIVFPLGALLFLMVIAPIRASVRRARAGEAATQGDIARLWNIGNKATLICAVLWAVSGVVFASVFSSMHAEFGLSDAFHFFISLVLCGGVAWIYPYFGMTLLALLVYYPKVIAPSMWDPQFARRCERLRFHNNIYLLSAAAIPLTAVALLVFRQNLPRVYILIGATLTLLGLLAAYIAHRKVEQTLEQFSKIFADARLEYFGQGLSPNPKRERGTTRSVSEGQPEA